MGKKHLVVIGHPDHKSFLKHIKGILKDEL